jgi:hypothetical protein
MPLNPGILLSSLFQSCSNLRPIKLLTSMPVINIISSIKITPEPGMILLKSNNIFGKYCEGIRLFTISKKNLISAMLSPNGIQKSNPATK